MSDYLGRCRQLQFQLRRRKLDALLVSQPENRRYLSGYSASDHGIGESAGMLLVPAYGAPLLCTDSRFNLQAEQETGLEVLIYRKGVIQLLSRLLRQYGYRRLGFESHYTLHSFGLKLTALAEQLGISLLPFRNLVESLRTIKSAGEIDLIRRSVALNEHIFQDIYSTIAVGMTEIDVSIAIETAMKKAGAERPSFATIVAAGANSARPHAVPTTHQIGANEPIIIDMGLILDGYCSDMTRSFTIGKSSEQFLSLHRIVRAAQNAGVAAISPGVPMNEVDRAARRVIEAAGYGHAFGHALGHGVGLAVHEAPQLSTRSSRKLKPGMIVTVEPGIYLPGWGGIRLENMVAVHEDGAEVLNNDQTWLDV